MRLAAFIIALLLLDGSVDPTRGWLIALVVVTGLVALRVHLWRPLHAQPAVDIRLAAFIIAVLLLAGTIDPTRGWLIALSAVSGLAMVAPHTFSLDLFGARRDRRWRHWGPRSWRWQSGAYGAANDQDDDPDWKQWELHMDRRLRRSARSPGDDWS